MLRQFTSIFVGILLFIVFIVISSSIYIVDETKQVFETRFGEIIGDPINGPGKKEAGLKFRVPFITKVHEFEKRYLEWDDEPERVSTRNKVFIEIDTFARWRIEDATKFFEAVTDERSAQSILTDRLNGAARTILAAHDLVEVIRSKQRKVVIPEGQSLDEQTELEPFSKGRSALAQQVMENAAPNLMEEFGIRLLDFRFKRINYTDKVREEIFKRMITERITIATEFRAEGDEEALGIMGDQQRKLKTIMSTAYLEKQQIKGEADAKAVAIYAEAFDQSVEAREFYEFLKTMETLESTLSKDDTLIFSTDSDFFRYLKRSAPTKE
jgi:membrane protease subunit HflC